jgi:hypothetical protein
LVNLSNSTGSDQFFPLCANQVTVGRDSGGIFKNDPYMMPEHCRITRLGEQVILEDASGACGVLLSVIESPLRAGDFVRVGVELMRFDIPDGLVEDATLTLLAGTGPEDATFAVSDDVTTIGRSKGSLQFPNDNLLSEEHVEIRRIGRSFAIRDLDSYNGTYLRVRGPQPVTLGARFFIGQLLVSLIDADEVRAAQSGS